MLDLPVLRPDLTYRNEVEVLLDRVPVLWEKLHCSVMEHNIIPVQQQCSIVTAVKIGAPAMLALLLSACYEVRIGAGAAAMPYRFPATIG